MFAGEVCFASVVALGMSPRFNVSSPYISSVRLRRAHSTCLLLSVLYRGGVLHLLRYLVVGYLAARTPLAGSRPICTSNNIDSIPIDLLTTVASADHRTVCARCRWYAVRRPPRASTVTPETKPIDEERRKQVAEQLLEKASKRAIDAKAGLKAAAASVRRAGLADVTVTAAAGAGQTDPASG